METNRYAMESETSVWWEVQAKDPTGRWQCMSDHPSREIAEEYAFTGERIVRKRGLA